MKTAIFAGSFDPFTLGHLHITKVASSAFDKVIICIATNPEKHRTFSKELMKKGIEETIKENKLSNCKVICYDGLIVDLAKKENAQIIVRGLRNFGDFEYEEKVAKEYYKQMGIYTMYVDSGKYVGIKEDTSSTKVRNLLKENKPISNYVPRSIEVLITK